MKKTIKIIDLLNKIANDEEVPAMVRMNEMEECEDIIFLYDKDIQDYKSKDDDFLFEIIFNKSFPVLNLEVEIIEEDKKIDYCKSYECFEGVDDYIEHLRDKIDNLIDAINELKGKSE